MPRQPLPHAAGDRRLLDRRRIERPQHVDAADGPIRPARPNRARRPGVADCGRGRASGTGENIPQQYERSEPAVQLPPNAASPSGHGRVTDIIPFAGSGWPCRSLWRFFLAAMLPPLDFDVCEYHLQAPKEFFQQGQITFLPHNVYANMPLGTEMLSLLAMVLAGDWWWGALAGKTVIAAFTPLCALATVAAGRRFYSTGAGVVAALVYISIPWIVERLVTRAWSRGRRPATCSWPCTPCCCRDAEQREQRSQDAASHRLCRLGGLSGRRRRGHEIPGRAVRVDPAGGLGLCRTTAARQGSGSAVGGRGTAQADLTANPCRSNLNPEPDRLSHSSRLMVFLLAAAVGCGLWFGKNWVLTGNPTYPLLYEVFDGKTWNADKDQQWNHVHRPHDFSAETARQGLGQRGRDERVAQPTGRAVGGLGVCSADCRGEAAALPGGCWPTWHLSLPCGGCSPIGSIAFGYPCCRCWRCWPARGLLEQRRLVAIVLFEVCCWPAWRRTSCWPRPGPATPGSSRSINSATTAAWIDPWHRYFNNDAHGGAVLAVGDAAVFDLRPPVFYNTCFDDCIFEQLVKGKTAKEIRAEFASRHIAYVFVNWGEIARYRRTYGFTDFVQPEVFDGWSSKGFWSRLAARWRRIGMQVMCQGDPAKAVRVALASRRQIG